MHDDLVKRLRNAAQWADKGLVITPSVCLEAADAIEELSKAQAQWIEQERNVLLKSIPKWIPVTERLPELGVSVFTYCPAIRNIEIQSLEKHVGNLHWENQHGDWQDLEAVDLWMPLPPLPEPPKEEH